MNCNLSKQSKLILLSLLILILLGSISYGGWRYWESRQEASEPQEQPAGEPGKPYIIGEQPSPPSIPITKPTDDPDWNLYINEKYGFSVEYPSGWEVEEEGNTLFEDVIALRNPNLGSLWILVDKASTLGVFDWSAEKWDVLVLEKGDLPKELNAALAGTPSLIGYSPPGGQGWASAFAVLKKGGCIFVLKNKAAGRGDSPLWDIYEHFLRTFEFEGTENIPDELPKFPMGF